MGANSFVHEASGKINASGKIDAKVARSMSCNFVRGFESASPM
jgi:hypothetical protein